MVKGDDVAGFVMHVSFQHDKKSWMKSYINIASPLEVLGHHCLTIFWWLRRVSPPIFDRFKRGLNHHLKGKHQLTVV